MKKIHSGISRYLIEIIGLAVVMFVFFSIANAQGDANITFPVAELGGCESKEACHTYCEVPGNMKQCINFAEKNGLMSSTEISEARKFLAAGGKGPGGCTSKNECESYCNDSTNIRECVDFAEKNDMMPREELEEAKKVIKALESGVKLPGGCKNKIECEAYCASGNADNMKECITFAKAAGFMSEKELEESEKVLKAIEKGHKPPKCRGDEECAVYCSQEQNIMECVEFGVAAGFITEQEAEMMRKTGGKGPGGCVGKQCETFCEDPTNREICFSFAKENGLISEDELNRRQEEMNRFKNEFSNMPDAVKECLRSTLGSDFEKMLADGPPSGDMESKMRGCFEQGFGPQGEQGDPTYRGPQGMGQERMMPGGAEGTENFEERRQFAPGVPGEQYPEEYRQQFEEQYREQYQQQFQEQYQQQFQEQYQQYQEGQYQQGEYQQGQYPEQYQQGEYQQSNYQDGGQSEPTPPESNPVSYSFPRGLASIIIPFLELLLGNR